MELEEFKVGVWYESNYNSNKFKFLSIGEKRPDRGSTWINVSTLTSGGHYIHEDWYSNQDYWNEAKEANYSEIEQYIPEEYRTPIVVEPLLFN